MAHCGTFNSSFMDWGLVRMGNFMFASWVIHMSMLFFFSYLLGLVMKEWKNVKRKTYLRLIIALVTLIISFVIMTYGSMQGLEEVLKSFNHEKIEKVSSYNVNHHETTNHHHSSGNPYHILCCR